MLANITGVVFKKVSAELLPASSNAGMPIVSHMSIPIGTFAINIGILCVISCINISSVRSHRVVKSRSFPGHERLRRHTLIGEALGLQFSVVFDVAEDTMTIRYLDITVGRECEAELAGFVEAAEKFKSPQSFFLTFVQYAELNVRTRTQMPMYNLSYLCNTNSTGKILLIVYYITDTHRSHVMYRVLLSNVNDQVLLPNISLANHSLIHARSTTIVYGRSFRCPSEPRYLFHMHPWVQLMHAFPGTATCRIVCVARGVSRGPITPSGVSLRMARIHCVQKVCSHFVLH